MKETIGAQYKSMTTQMSIATNMIVSAFIMFVICYFIASKVYVEDSKVCCMVCRVCTVHMQCSGGNTARSLTVVHIPLSLINVFVCMPSCPHAVRCTIFCTILLIPALLISVNDRS